LGGELKRFMNKMATEIDKVKADPDEMAKKIVPELKLKVRLRSASISLRSN
jgi:hypothetical protein